MKRQKKINYQSQGWENRATTLVGSLEQSRNTDEQFDLITTFDAVHDQAKPLNVLRGIYRALKNDGVYLMQDIHGSSEVHNNLDHPVGPLLYGISITQCMTVSLAQNGDGLGTMWGQEKARELLTRAGFTRIDIHQLEHDYQNDYYVIQK